MSLVVERADWRQRFGWDLICVLRFVFCVYTRLDVVFRIDCLCLLGGGGGGGGV